MTQIATTLLSIRQHTGFSQQEVAKLLGTSLASVVKWETSNAVPSPAQTKQIIKIANGINNNEIIGKSNERFDKFESTGSRQKELPLFQDQQIIELTAKPLSPLLDRIKKGRYFSQDGEEEIVTILKKNSIESPTVAIPPTSGMSAGKNTYTYDAHTYHTKMPPQGIAELLKHYLPNGGLVLDPFAGSGMTGVAARVLGYDCILNELSTAACFISNQFVSYIDPELFRVALRSIAEATKEVRQSLYTTHHRNTGEKVEFEYLVWSYSVICNYCSHEFSLWDQCRKYGKSVREHKILSEFPCPNCNRTLKKSKLTRTTAHPVVVAYKQGANIEMCSPDEYDIFLIDSSANNQYIIDGFFPQTPLYSGVNLRQPLRHGFDQINKFYSSRNLAAMSHLWHSIHRIDDDKLAAMMAFVFTSLYQRVTRFSEFRFWGGSGNSANFNVPHIFKEANVFTTFERKAQTILDHLETTASSYKGQAIVVQNSATSLDYLPDNSIDLIFADPPFGANINYSEMNILWESWLNEFTDTENEMIVSKYQKKDITHYQALLTTSLSECYRVLRDKHWLLLVFMNSSEDIWSALRTAITEAGFVIQQIDIFDKQHGTFKQFVSENTAGGDLVLHCLKNIEENIDQNMTLTNEDNRQSIKEFLDNLEVDNFLVQYIHVERESELDFRTLYSLWIAKVIKESGKTCDFATFRFIVENLVSNRAIEEQE